MIFKKTNKTNFICIESSLFCVHICLNLEKIEVISTEK